LLIRGYDPLDDAIDYGRYLLPLVRAEVERRDAGSPAGASPAGASPVLSSEEPVPAEPGGGVRVVSAVSNDGEPLGVAGPVGAVEA